jgi:hypothetical protein
MVVIMSLVQHRYGQCDMEERCSTENFREAHLGCVVVMSSIDRDEEMFVDARARAR